MKVSTYPEVIIGYEGEQNARGIEFDVESELNLWPGSVPTLFYRRPGEETVYPAVTSLSGNTLVWTPDGHATEIPGRDGAVQIVFTTPGTDVIVGKTRMLALIVKRSFSSGEPEAADNWITTLTDLAAQTTIAAGQAEDALTAAIAAQDAAEDAQSAAEFAQGESEAARDASIDARNAAQVAQSAAETARDASVSAKNLAAANVTLSESWAVGETGAREGENTNNSKYYSGLANNYANLALTYETNAIIKAQEAAQSADRANSKANIAYAKADEAQLYAYQANQSANRALMSESNASSSANIAAQKASIATNAAAIAESSATYAEQLAATAGYMDLYIDERGHLIFEKVNVDHVDFELENGRLIAIWQ